jgi:predicted MFS family arabinose efflux permease
VIATLAAVLVGVGWHAVYLWLGVVNLAIVPLLIWVVPKTTPAQAKAARPSEGGACLRPPARASSGCC